MNLNFEIIADKYLLGFVLRLLNFPVAVLGRLFPKKHLLLNPKAIVICKFKGMGSIIQATPLIQTLKLNFPEAKLIFLSTQSNKNILDKIPEIDQKILINDKSLLIFIQSFSSSLFRLLCNKPSVFIDLEVYSNISSLVSILCLSKNRLGFYINPTYYKRGIYTQMMYYNTRSPISDTYLQFARMMGAATLIPEIKLQSDDVSNVLAKFDLAFEQFIIINPNASDLRLERRWPKENFLALIEKLSETFEGHKIVIIGSANEVDYCSQFEESKKLKKLVGKTSIEELTSLIKNSLFVISNDTGPMHLSFAFQKTCFALFGPCSPDQYGRHKTAIPIYTNLYCSPCIHEFQKAPCNGNNICMKSIQVDLVFQAIMNWKDKRAAELSNPEIIYEYMDQLEQNTIVGKMNFRE